MPGAMRCDLHTNVAVQGYIRLSRCPLLYASQVQGSKISDKLIGKGSPTNDKPTLRPSVCLICRTCTRCFIRDKGGISDSAAEQPHCGSLPKPASQVRINSVDQQIKLHCFYSFPLSKPPLSSRKSPTLTLARQSFSMKKCNGQIAAFPDRAAERSSPHLRATPCCPCPAEEHPPRTPSGPHLSAKRRNWGARIPLGKEGALKDPTKQNKFPTQPGIRQHSRGGVWLET